MNKKRKYLLLIILPSIIGFIITLGLFLIFLEPIIKGFGILEGAWLGVSIILVRMGLVIFMSSYMFKKWFAQEYQFFSDLPFLFGLFFLILFFGKAYDLLYNLTFYTIDEISFLVILKIRFIIAVLSITPMYYFSIGMILFFLSLNDRYKKLNNKEFSKRIQLIVLLLIVSIEMIIIILFLDLNTNRIILPSIVIPSFLIIVIVFYIAYKNKRLSQVNPLILAIGFGAYLISQIMRPVFQILFGETSLTVIISEIIDLVIYLIIFLGLIKKIEYK